MSLFAVMSDSHDQVANLAAAVSWCNQYNAENSDRTIQALFHCGDLVSPFMLKQLTLFQGEVHLIFGNNSGDREPITQRCGSQFPNITHYGERAFFEHSGYQIALVHYPIVAKELASQGKYDLVCCGHSHKPIIQRFGRSLLVNPGHLLGENELAGFFIVDFTARRATRIKVGHSMFARPVPVMNEGGQDFPA